MNFSCIQGSFVKGKPGSILFSFSLSAPPGFESHKEPTSILFEKENEEKISKRNFYPEDDDGNVVQFGGEILKFSVILTKT